VHKWMHRRCMRGGAQGGLVGLVYGVLGPLCLNPTSPCPFFPHACPPIVELLPHWAQQQPHLQHRLLPPQCGLVCGVQLLQPRLHLRQHGVLPRRLLREWVLVGAIRVADLEGGWRGERGLLTADQLVAAIRSANRASVAAPPPAPQGMGTCWRHTRCRSGRGVEGREGTFDQLTS